MVPLRDVKTANSLRVALDILAVYLVKAKKRFPVGGSLVDVRIIDSVGPESIAPYKRIVNDFKGYPFRFALLSVNRERY